MRRDSSIWNFKKLNVDWEQRWAAPVYRSDQSLWIKGWDKIVNMLNLAPSDAEMFVLSKRVF